MCLNWVPVSFVMPEFTTVEQWDGLEAQVAIWYSDILLRRAALRWYQVNAVTPAIYRSCQWLLEFVEVAYNCLQHM